MEVIVKPNSDATMEIIRKQSQHNYTQMRSKKVPKAKMPRMRF